MNQPVKLAAFILGAVALAACGSAKTSDYYTLNLQPPANPAPVTAEKQAGVAPPRAAHLLRQDRIVYFTEDNQLNYYQYHRWAESPVFMVQKMLIEQLRGSGVFDNVVPYRAQEGLDYLVRGELLALEEVDRANEIRARFALALELVRQEDGRVIWSGRESCNQAVAAKTVDSVVSSLSACADQTLASLVQSLRQAVAQEVSRQEEQAKR